MKRQLWVVLSLTFLSACADKEDPPARVEKTSRPEQNLTNSEELTNRFLKFALAKDTQSISQLIKEGFLPNKNLYNREAHALLFIVNNSHKYYDESVAKTLVDNGADINLQGNRIAPLHAATKNNDLRVVKHLLKMKANPNIVGTNAPLHISVQEFLRNNLTTTLDVLDELLAAPNIDLRIKNLDGKEPLYYAYNDRHTGNPLPTGFDMSEVIKRFANKGVTFP